jgi:hypothetical protein
MWKGLYPGSLGWRKWEGRRGGGEEDQGRRVGEQTILVESERCHDHDNRYASYLVYREGGDTMALMLFSSQLLLNLAWTPIF